MAQADAKNATLTASPLAVHRYWTMYKLPMFGCTDSSQVLTEINNCTKSFPDAYIRLVAFDQVCASAIPASTHVHSIGWPGSDCLKGAGVSVLHFAGSSWHKANRVRGKKAYLLSRALAGPPGAVRWLPGAPPAERERVHRPGEALHLSS